MYNVQNMGLKQDTASLNSNNNSNTNKQTVLCHPQDQYNVTMEW